MRSFIVIFGLVLLVRPAIALAQGGVPVAPANVWLAWNWDPFILTGLVLAWWLYVRGVRDLWQRAGAGRGVSGWRVAAFGGGLVTLFVALISPLDALSHALLSAHMVQHLLLILVAAPLLVLGATPVSLAWSVPQRWRRDLMQWWHHQSLLPGGWRFLTAPIVVWLLHAAALWLWHVPLFYQAALRSHFIHMLEHACFLGTAVLFWWTLAQCSMRGRLSYGAGVLFIFTTALVGGLLGALMTFASQVWYPAYAAGPAAWGLTPLEDQQLAGAIMWIPAGIFYLLAALILLGVWLQKMERSEGHAPSKPGHESNRTTACPGLLHR